MTLQQLRYAVGISRARSINSAAEELHISQPSLSAAIRELEGEIGIRIFSRSARGVQLTGEGAEFLAYARQVLEQAELLEERWIHGQPVRRLFSVSTQHYAFAVEAFVRLIRETDPAAYELTLRECRTHEILEDVQSLRSEIGIVYRNAFNERVLDKVFHDGRLVFTPLCVARPHVFLSARHPLASQKTISLDDLDPFPCLSFDQGAVNSFHYSEEILPTRLRPKSIVVTDRATLFNLLIGLDGYTISTGIINRELNGPDIIAVALDLEDPITVGYVRRVDALPGQLMTRYVALLQEILATSAG